MSDALPDSEPSRGWPVLIGGVKLAVVVVRAWWFAKVVRRVDWAARTRPRPARSEAPHAAATAIGTTMSTVAVLLTTCPSTVVSVKSAMSSRYGRARCPRRR